MIPLLAAAMFLWRGDGATPLHGAAYQDDREGARRLIASGASVNAANDLGATPLWLACQNGSAAMARLLLDAGANPKAALLAGETVLMTAARTGNTEIVRLLLAKGADPNARATRGQTALMWAVAQRHAAAVQALLEGGADIQARTDVWTQRWQTAPDQDAYPGYHVDIKHGGETALLFAARVGDLASARLLVAAGAKVNDTAASGISATVLAAHGGNGELVEFLLAKGADPNAAAAGYTALHAALPRRNFKAVAALLDHGADANAKLKTATPTRRSSQDFYFHPAFVGATPFWLAARFCQPEAMRLLARYGADARFVHNVEYWGTRTKTSEFKRESPGATTALMAAVGMGRGAGFRLPEPGERGARMLEAVKLAVELGVDVNAADSEGRTALETALAMGYREVAALLKEKGAKLERPVRPMKKESIDD